MAAQLKREEHSTEIRKRHGRQHLVVHYVDGSKVQGTCRSMNLQGAGFYLEFEDDAGISTEESGRIQFSEIKYVANVKSYTGKFDRHQEFQEYTPGGSHIVVKFRDGEIAEGTTMHAYVPDHPRFYLIPHDPNSNHINMLIEQSALERVYEPQEYLAEMKREKELRKQQKEASKLASSQEFGGDGGGADSGSDTSELSQEESMGDFYFGTHNYPGALEQYQVAFLAHPDSARLKKKVVVTLINIGIQFIKSREYPRALEYMERAAEIDPRNPHAKKKAKQLRKIIEKTKRRMRDYYEQQSGGSSSEEL
jgi:tetratricopeptide (TPR) repeat protein